MAKIPLKRIPDLQWTDCDSDRVCFSTDRGEIGDTGAVATISITNPESGQDAAVYIDEMDAHQLITWLKAALETNQKATT